MMVLLDDDLTAIHHIDALLQSLSTIAETLAAQRINARMLNLSLRSLDGLDTSRNLLDDIDNIRRTGRNLQIAGIGRKILQV